MGKHARQQQREGGGLKRRVKSKVFVGTTKAKRVCDRSLWHRFGDILMGAIEPAGDPPPPGPALVDDLRDVELLTEAQWQTKVQSCDTEVRELLASGKLDMLLDLPLGCLQKMREVAVGISYASLLCACVLYTRWRWRCAGAGVEKSVSYAHPSTPGLTVRVRLVSREHPSMPDLAVLVLLCFISSKVNDRYCVELKCITSVLKDLCPSMIKCDDDVKAEEMKMLQGMGWKTHVSEKLMQDTLQAAQKFRMHPSEDMIDAEREEQIRASMGSQRQQLICLSV